MPDAIYRLGRRCLASMLAECGGVPDGAALAHRIAQIPGAILTRPPRSETDPDFGDVEALVPPADFPGEVLLELGPGYRRAYGWRATWTAVPRWLGLSKRIRAQYEPHTDATGEWPAEGGSSPEARWVRLRAAPALRALLAQGRDWTALYLPRERGAGSVRIPGERDDDPRIVLEAEEVDPPADPRAVIEPPGERGAA